MEERIALVSYFGGEATGFTPWLETHPEIVKSILNNNELKVYKRELKVNSFYIDLMLTDENRKGYIVENQYGISDHDHFGKCIMYKWLTNAQKVIWIAEEFRKEYVNYARKNDNLILCQMNLYKIPDDIIQMKLYIYGEKESYIIFNIKDGKLEQLL